MRINVVLNWQIEIVGVPDEDYTDEQHDAAVQAAVDWLGEQNLHSEVDLMMAEREDNEPTVRIDLTGEPVDD